MNETTNIPEPSHRDECDNRDKPMAGRFKFRRVDEITGMFVLVVVAVLVAAVVWTGHSQRWFKSRVPLWIILPEAGAAGIRQGSEVYFLGTLVGSVSDVVVDTNGPHGSPGKHPPRLLPVRARGFIGGHQKEIRRGGRFVFLKSRAAWASRCRKRMLPSSAMSSFKARWKLRSRKSAARPWPC